MLYKVNTTNKHTGVCGVHMHAFCTHTHTHTHARVLCDTDHRNISCMLILGPGDKARYWQHLALRNEIWLVKLTHMYMHYMHTHIPLVPSDIMIKLNLTQRRHVH